jgi:hypothetical protein
MGVKLLCELSLIHEYEYKCLQDVRFISENF